MEITFVNFAIVTSLIPFCQGLVQLVKHDSMPSYVVRLLSLVIGIGMAFLVREANIEGFSVSLDNVYTTVITGLAVALISSGFYDTTKSGIMKQVAQSEVDVSLPANVMGVDEKESDDPLKPVF